jgi:hypothetical protein
MFTSKKNTNMLSERQQCIFTQFKTAIITFFSNKMSGTMQTAPMMNYCQNMTSLRSFSAKTVTIFTYILTYNKRTISVLRLCASLSLLSFLTIVLTSQTSDYADSTL